LTVSHELFRDTVVEASYIGNHGLHIWRRNVNKNEIPPGVPCRGSECDGSTRTAREQIARATLDITTQDAGILTADNRPLRGIGNVTTDLSDGNSTYNALQVWVNRRFTDRLAFQAAYTWGHAISDVALTSFTNATTDPFDYKADKGDSDLDRRHTFVGNVVYVLPSFKEWGKAAHYILGDWQLNGIASRFGATPIEITSDTNTLGTAVNPGQRPDYTGASLYLHTSDATQHLNPAAFAIPPAGRRGSLGRGSVRGKPITNIDFSMAKNWRFRERYGFQFRAEMFNVFNHTNFIGYDTVVTHSTFGTLNAAQAPREIQFGFKFTF
jgi:hypothetical protein